MNSCIDQNLHEIDDSICQEKYLKSLVKAFMVSCFNYSRRAFRCID